MPQVASKMTYAERLVRLEEKSFLFPVPQYVFINSELSCNLIYYLYEFPLPIIKAPIAFYKVMDHFIKAYPYSYVKK